MPAALIGTDYDEPSALAAKSMAEYFRDPTASDIATVLSTLTELRGFPAEVMKTFVPPWASHLAEAAEDLG